MSQLERAIREQAYAAVQEADVILLLVDGKTGVHPLDERLAEVLRKSGPPVLMVVNKMDNLPRDVGHLDFWSLGRGDPIPVSAISGKGSGDLLDAIVAKLPEPPGRPSRGGCGPCRRRRQTQRWQVQFRKPALRRGTCRGQ